MLLIGILLFFVWFVTSFVIVVDMFKKHTAIGCLGLLLLPILPFIWVFKGYSGNKKRAGIILYGSALISFSMIGYEWYSASKELEPFMECSASLGFDFGLKQIGSSGSKDYYTLISKVVYTPQSDFTSVEEMLKVIENEKIRELSMLYPEGIGEGSIIRVAIPTNSGFVVVYEITAPGVIEKSYITSLDDL